jgi:hypothetical protein
MSNVCHFRVKGEAMTEAEWQKAADPRPMLEFLRTRHRAARRKAGRRKFRLFACACLRDIWPLLHETGSRQAVEVAERYCDGLADDHELEVGAETARRALGNASGSVYWQAAEAANHVCRTRFDSGEHPSVVHAAVSAAHAYANDRTESNKRLKHAKELAAKLAEQATWVRDIFGNPFRPVKFHKKWRTDTAASLARQMYESREFSAMPILADALQDAGCDNEEVLSHCRGAGPHVRGCWVVDLVLGKA